MSDQIRCQKNGFTFKKINITLINQPVVKKSAISSFFYGLEKIQNQALKSLEIR